MTVASGISLLIGIVHAIIQWTVPSLEGTLLGLTKDLVTAVDLPTWFAFCITSLLNALGVLIIWGGILVIFSAFSRRG